MQDYRVQLDSYSGPMDLLLYLIRREEVDIYDIPIARILEQYLKYVRLLKVLDPDTAGDFLVLAATLMEIKSRLLLPRPPPEVEDDDSLDPRADLVRQLLAYRSFREAALALSRRGDVRARRFGRPRTGAPGSEEHVDIEDVQIWDLLTAFNKLLASVGQQPAMHEVIYDDTPITLHAADILDLLQRDGPVMPFERIFQGRSRSEMIGLFLALLELIRQYRVRIDQPKQFGPIRVHLIDPTPITEAMVSASERASEDLEPDACAGAPFEQEGLPGKGAGEEVFEDEEEDEFSRRIGAVQIGEVDLGRSLDREPRAGPPGGAGGTRQGSAETGEEAARGAQEAGKTTPGAARGAGEQQGDGP